MPIIRISGIVVSRRPGTSTARSGKVVDVGTATIVGAAIRCHKLGIDGRRRRWLIGRLTELAEEGDPTAKLVLEKMMRSDVANRDTC